MRRDLLQIFLRISAYLSFVIRKQTIYISKNIHCIQEKKMHVNYFICIYERNIIVVIFLTSTKEKTRLSMLLQLRESPCTLLHLSHRPLHMHNSETLLDSLTDEAS